MSAAKAELGIACGRCDAFNPMGRTHCDLCGNALALGAPTKPTPRPTQAIAAALNELVAGDRPLVVPASDPPPASAERRRTAPVAPAPPGTGTVEPAPKLVAKGADLAEISQAKASPSEAAPPEEPMDQAKYYVCESCMTPVPSGHKFCGRCGAAVPEHVLNLRTEYFGRMQDPTRARLVLIRGEGLEGVSWYLEADQHVLGRQGELEFPDDAFVSPRHANFFYRDGRLAVRDEGSLNGVYVRVRGSVEIAPGDYVIAGEQLFRLEATPKASDPADAEGTFFYGSPKYPSSFRLNQVLEGGAVGMTVCAHGNSLQIGREDGDLNFPGDVYMSAKHCTIAESGGKYLLTDHDSRNGTFVRIQTEQLLGHGDFVFIGRKLMRVELNTN
jgi:pSer/pThr/pTyr-binding forkhead associated (FHA) protein